ncbi:glycoside hydrolase family 5 protein [Cecembia rubra]|uniref:Aryl-phospho-beta-D-glucosidase BglC (GH1 family) n=1 Tax=Cecembia rubra TaxID=1485585 RepID=A0A2P8E1S4_9BACT|nr:cellulase family glycosylhydrolase [Cecembia rubra]PSL03430.1 aryl-phospho-beta-D-glucosidase BglC (GH1 family) [Cecembia rubra]
MNHSRREFLKKSTLISAGLATAPLAVKSLNVDLVQNALPYWRGFNLLDFFSPEMEKGRKNPPEFLTWMADWGFNFVRIPISYPSYLNFDRSKPILASDVMNFDEGKIEQIDQLVNLAHKNGLHVSLNLHRAPGFCINAGFIEPYNLWKDQEALDAFCAHWEMWSKRYKNINSDKLSFDLVNEPFMREDPNDQHSPGGPVPVEDYYRVAKAALNTIKSISPERLVIANGNGGGGIAVPELADLDLGQSCRGYHPMSISHHKASWVYKEPDLLPDPIWPGEFNGRYHGREMIEQYYAPWVELLQKGVGVHCGECGAYNKTPHAVFLRWFEDVLDFLNEKRIGFGIWEFSGAFGILNSGRTDVDYEDWYGQKLDRKYLNLLMKYA